MRFFVSLLLFAESVVFCRALPSEAEFIMLPQPQNVEMLSGYGISASELTHIVKTGSFDLPQMTGITATLPVGDGCGKPLEMTLTDDDVPDNEEGYVLEITYRGVLVAARSRCGLFYGCQTLNQLLDDSRDFNVAIPAMKITDWPDISYRAVHFDLKHHRDVLDYYYREIDKLASYKINAIIWESEDKLEFTRRPEVSSPNALSKAEMQAINRYARERFIEITPLVQGLGHASFILKHHPELRENPGSDWEFCPSNPDTYKLQFDLYRDALEAMPGGRYLHIGGDEISAIGIDERCRATGKTPFELQMTWLEKVCRFARDNGRIPIFWDDMPLKYGDVWDIVNSKDTEESIAARWNAEKLNAAVDLFPRGCIYMRWNYRNPSLPGHLRILNWYRDKGLTVMGATAASFGDSPFMPRDHSLIDNIRAFSTLVYENRLAGILSTAWDDGSPHSETVWRGFIAQGEYGWNSGERSVAEFELAHGQREFGFPASENLTSFIDSLELAADFFDGAFVKKGRRNPAWGVTDFTLIDLPDCNAPGEWSERYSSLIENAGINAGRLAAIHSAINHADSVALRNHYTLDVYRHTARLFEYPVSLLLALHEADCAVTAEKKLAELDKVATICNYFHEMRESFERCYSKTRTMTQPEGYLPDMNHHKHLAAMTLNSDWWFLYEIPMTKKVCDWTERERRRLFK